LLLLEAETMEATQDQQPRGTRGDDQAFKKLSVPNRLPPIVPRSLSMQLLNFLK
jgi:hypothetical protein